MMSTSVQRVCESRDGAREKSRGGVDKKMPTRNRVHVVQLQIFKYQSEATYTNFLILNIKNTWLPLFSQTSIIAFGKTTEPNVSFNTN